LSYSVIYADPPWSYDDSACNEQWRGTPYATLSLDQLQALPVHKLAADDCALFMWATYPLLPEALATIKGWGFEYKSIAFQWLKLNRKAGTPFYGLGRWTRGNTEPCLLAVRGKPKPVSKSVSQLVIEPEIIHDPIRGHSAKPDVVRERIVELMGDVPRIELFARERAAGWDQTGLELDGLPIQALLSYGA
jgi:N6-adenosine-specific RNA methylase IME4